MTWSRVFFYGLIGNALVGFVLIMSGHQIAAVPEVILTALCTIGSLASRDNE